MTTKTHIWRYKADTPREERPWIVSREGTCDPEDYETWNEAVYAATGRALVPWVIEGETGTSILSKWENDEPIGFEPWCATCGWHGKVQRCVVDGEGDSEAWMAACDEGNAHEQATGHRSV
jgi:hypothetical protein